MRRLAELAFVRVVSIICSLGINIFVVRFLSLSEIGFYYLFAALAYIGNAALFVGADLALQRTLKDLSVRAEIDVASLLLYQLRVAIPGCLVVQVCVVSYCRYINYPSVRVSVFCTCLTVAMFCSSVARNLLQLADRSMSSAFVNLVEQVLRLLLVAGCIRGGFNTGGDIIAANAAAAFIAAAVGIVVVARTTRRCRESYFLGYRSAWACIAPIGASGLMNWAQLQGYRPLMNSLLHRPDVIGAVSFLTVLGSTLANAFTVVLGQVWIPRQYRTEGKATSAYLRMMIVVVLVLGFVSIPIGWAFLKVTGRFALLPYLYLLPVCVMLEGGNALIGIYTNHANVLGKRLWSFPSFGVIGLITTGTILLVPCSIRNVVPKIAIGLVAGQLVVVCLLHIYSASSMRKVGGRNIAAVVARSQL